MDPFGPWRAGFALWSLMAQAQVVAAAPRERRTMVAEKGLAFARAAAAGVAAAQGKGPEAVAAAAIRPLRRRTGANCVHAHTAAARAKGMTAEMYAEFLRAIALAAGTKMRATARSVEVDERFRV